MNICEVFIINVQNICKDCLYIMLEYILFVFKGKKVTCYGVMSLPHPGKVLTESALKL